MISSAIVNIITTLFDYNCKTIVHFFGSGRSLAPSPGPTYQVLPKATRAMNGEPQKRAQPASSGGPNAKAARASSGGPARASSGGPAALTQGEVTKTMALRVKYRVLSETGQKKKNGCPSSHWGCTPRIAGACIASRTW